MEELFSEAIKERNAGHLNKSRRLLLQIVERYSNHPKMITVYAVLGGVVQDLGKYDESFKHFKNALNLNPDLELASLGVYLSYVHLEQYDDAIEEMDRFLSANPADLYKDTLKELIQDLKNGYARDHESTIVRLAKKHGVSIVD